MTTVTFFCENDRIVKVTASGHCGQAESGKDIVCAAVSTLVQTAYLAIADISPSVEYKRNDDRAEFEFSVKADCERRHDVDVILRALTVGLNDLERGYPKFIKTEVKRNVY